MPDGWNIDNSFAKSTVELISIQKKFETEAKHCLEHCFIPLSVLLGPIQLISRTQNAQVFLSVSVRVQYTIDSGRKFVTIFVAIKNII
jgi:hypothetical protein